MTHHHFPGRYALAALATAGLWTLIIFALRSCG